MSVFYVPESAMGVVAHPDDIEFSCGGTLARWRKAGARVAYVLVTSGDVGIAEPGMTKARAAEIREAETLAAARVAGVDDVVFLREPDGLVQATLELRKKLVREIRRFRPEVVITGDPTVVWSGGNRINHPDHRAAALATMDAIFPAAGQRNLFEELADEGLHPHKVRKVYVTGRGEAEVFVNIEETIDIKIAALREHRSQMNGRDPGERIKQRSADLAKNNEMSYAEAFRVITLVNDETWAQMREAGNNPK